MKDSDLRISNKYVVSTVLVVAPMMNGDSLSPTFDENEARNFYHKNIFTDAVKRDCQGGDQTVKIKQKIICDNVFVVLALADVDWKGGDCDGFIEPSLDKKLVPDLIVEI